MKQVLTFILSFILLSSCQEDDSLKGISLENMHENIKEPYVTVINASEITCSVVSFDLEIKTEIIPENISFTHILIINTKNEAVKTRKTKNIFVEANCISPSYFEIVLYNEDTNQQSYPSFYTYNP